MFLKKYLIKKLTQGIVHVLFWCGVLLFYMYFFVFDSTDLRYIFSFSLFLMPITMATTYISIYKLIPKYLITKKYTLFALYSSYTLIISGYLIVVSVFYGLIYLSNFQYENMPPISRNLFLVMIAVYLVTLTVSAFKLLQLNLKNAEQKKQLETKILATQLKLKEQELNYLKMQIHPHFLFNTLNTIYGFSLRKADEAPEMILKLSNLLDYLLYKADKPFVLLTEEIQHIEDYIALEKMRFNQTLNLVFNHENTSETDKIAPMLLIPFVENSFKHGRLMDGVLSISIELVSTSGRIYFSIENTCSKSVNDVKGIGLENIKKRLEIMYQGQHSLEIKHTKKMFKANLILNQN